MKILKFTVLFWIAVFLNSLNAQTVDITWGPAMDLNGGVVEKIVGGDESGFYIVKKTEESRYYLESYDYLTLSQVTSNELLMPTVRGNATTYLDMFFLKGKLILLTTGVDVASKKKVAYIQYIKKDGTLANKPKIIGEMSTSNGDIEFQFKLTPDKENIFMYYHQMHKQYQGEPYTFKVIDANLMEKWAADLEMPYKGREFSVGQYEIGRSGNIYMIVYAEPPSTGKRSSRGPSQYTYFSSYIVKKKEFKDYKLETKKYIASKSAFTIDKEENIVIMGFAVKERTPDIYGVYYKKLNPTTYKFFPIKDLKLEVAEFDRATLIDFKSERITDNPEHYWDYNNMSVHLLDNGNSFFVAEHFYIEELIVGEGTGAEEYHYTYLYNDIIGAGADEEGKMEWVKRSPKNQLSRDDDGRYSSIYTEQVGNKVKILYNDHKKNIEEKGETGENIKQIKNPEKGTATVMTIFNDGSFYKEPLFSDDYSKITISPRVIYKKKDEQIIIMGFEKGEYRFGTFYFE